MVESVICKVSAVYWIRIMAKINIFKLNCCVVQVSLDLYLGLRKDSGQVMAGRMDSGIEIASRCGRHSGDFR